MRILIRTSKWAIWARRYASLAVPLVVIPILLHRERLIESDTFHIAAAVALAVSLLALTLSIIALARLWNTGDHGWDKAIWALLISLFCLSPYGWAAAMIERYPRVTDVATIDRQALPLVFDDATASMKPPIVLAESDIEAVFPNVRTRSYPLNAQQTFNVVLRLVNARGWDVRAQREPEGPQGEARINARVTTLFGYRGEVVLRIAGAPDGASIDMRSVSLNAIHDLGVNGRRIEEFMTALDTEVTALLRDNPNLTEPVVETPPEPVEAPEREAQ